MTTETRDIGCVVVSLREGRESLIIDTPAGEIVIEVNPLTSTKVRAVIRAPKSLRITRRRMEATDDAV
jgi:sRNA-binding carbon storage regulator CsrA